MAFDTETQRRMALNERNWDARTPIHVRSDFYALGRRDPLEWILPFEWDALGSLAGKDVAHLQCHLGVETMGLAKAGARTVGLDFSARAVEQADIAARHENLDVSYVRADVYDAIDALGGNRFDVVYTGKGALCYLPDLARWAEVVTGLLRPRGFLYLVEFHPLLSAFGLTARPGEPVDLTVRHDYLEGRGPVERDSSHTYTDGPPLAGDTVHYEWPHSLGEVVTALSRAGLRIDHLTEPDVLPFPRWPGMVRTDYGWWRTGDDMPHVPTLYALKASR
ncbi:class I SAM-dependent methyltransferase [Kutzneria kofuensis]|uniref:SAM-dependent methyltransferase n=1 Tax=Kutzneria kofuensis TaxID=103725 RepID=A0A7W9KF74_9PSEU|nr:class I SAM-dependent methyltransferase [Kutzneria kofuensis]MBB5891312.1 SAM-dependent methyltransferase [Kutzneria kofuensis]